MTRTKKLYEFIPDYAIAPGKSLDQALKDRGISQADFAKRTDRPLKTICDIINGYTQITSETAIQFEHVLGIPARFWLNLETNYRETLARIDERKVLEEQLVTLRKYPVNALIKLAWIPKVKDAVGQLQALMDYFGVATLKKVEDVFGKVNVAYKQSKAYPVDMFAIYSWLRKGEIDAQSINCKPYDAQVFKANLVKIKSLIGKEPSEITSKLTQYCAEAGVAVVFAPEIKGCRACGVSRWLKDKALIMLSLRHKTDDHLWFTFFHEAGHILRNKKKEIYVDIDSTDEEDVNETEANRFASNFLINPTDYVKFVNAKDFSVANIKKFALEQQVSPGIVVGRLQHDEHLPFQTPLNSLKIRYTWKNE